MLYSELQPVDSFQVKLAHPFSAYDRQMLSLFYQPLIGPDAVSLFLTLWADGEQSEMEERAHYDLMDILSKPLKAIFEARITLEAIGLLRTYKKKEQDSSRSFVYELLPPLDAPSFFNDPLLSTFLFSKIGEKPYRRLRSRFLAEPLPMEQYDDISRTFLDVFQPARSNEAAAPPDEQYRGKTEAPGVPFDQSSFNFELFYSGLSEQMIPASSLRKISPEIIAQLGFLYSLTPLDMQKAVMIAMDENLHVTEERLRKAAAEFYKMNRSQQPPKLQQAFVQPAEPPKEQMTREEELVYYLEHTPPKDMLREISGKEPFQVDIQLAERLIVLHQFPVGVVNVLLQYMMLRNDGKITNSFAERIASHWANKKVNDTKTALELSRKEHDQYKKWLAEGKKQPARKSKPAREEKVPEWFYKRDQKQQKTETADFDVEQERQKLLKELGIQEDGVK